MGAGILPQPNETINKLNVKYLGGILIAGAAGGLLFWVLAKWTGTPMPEVFGPLTFLVLMFVGSLSAAFGVYLLTASDVTAMRTYIFAVVCGLAWQPMIQAATRIATNAAATRQTAALDEKISEVKSAAQTGNSQKIDSAVRDAVPVIQRALTASADVTDTSKKEQISNASKEAIKALQTASSTPGNTTVDALKTISITAAHSGDTEVAIQGVQSLHSIGLEAIQRGDPDVAENASRSLETIAAQSRNVTVKDAASASALKMRFGTLAKQ